jgi:hypothetical protein
MHQGKQKNNGYLRNKIHFLSVIGIWYEVGRVINFYNARRAL